MRRRCSVWFVLPLMALAGAGCGSDDSTEPKLHRGLGQGRGKPTAKAGHYPAELRRFLRTPRQQQFKQAPTTAELAQITSDNTSGEGTVEATAQYLEAVIKYADKVWTKWFTTNGYREPQVGYEIITPGHPYTTRCKLPDGSNTFESDFPNAFYCPIDPNQVDNGTVILPVDTMRKMWTGNIFEQHVSNLKRVGDFAAGMITAHEFGHHVQDELAQQSGATDPRNPYRELIADCFSGVWAYSVFVDGYLQEGDVDEAVNALEIIGDNLGSHGTGAERQNAFLIGYTGTTDKPGGGVPLRCIENYWIS